MRLPPRRGARPGTREQIVTMLRRSPLTAREIATRLGLTHNAVRDHLATLQRDGLIREGGLKRGVSRPATVYELVPDADAVFSRAYVPFVAHLMRALQERLPQGDLDRLMHNVGRSLAAEWPPLQGDLPERVAAASTLLEGLGALNEVERDNGGYVIRGYGCVFAAAVHGRPDVCRVMESLLQELLQVRVEECCERESERPRCRFAIAGHPPGGPAKRRARG